MTGTYNLAIQQGATYQKVFIWRATPCCGAAGSGPAPVDITGYSVSMQIRPAAQSSLVYYNASGDIVLGGKDGSIALTIPAEDTENFTWYRGVYDLLITSPQGFTTKLLSGKVSVQPVVTKPSTFTADSSNTADSSLTADS